MIRDPAETMSCAVIENRMRYVLFRGGREGEGGGRRRDRGQGRETKCIISPPIQRLSVCFFISVAARVLAPAAVHLFRMINLSPFAAHSVVYLLRYDLAHHLSFPAVLNLPSLSESREDYLGRRWRSPRSPAVSIPIHREEHRADS